MSPWRPTARDGVWIVLFLALHFASPVVNDAEAELLVAFAAFEVLAPRIAWFQAHLAGRVASVGFRLLLAYLLMGVTGGIASSYYLTLLLPVVAAATLFSASGVALATIAAALSYLSFLLFIDFRFYTIPPDQLKEINFRLLFLFLAAYLTHQLARDSRNSASRYQSLAEELANANRNLKDAQGEVVRSERLAALGQLTAGLAHELRNPLGTIKTSAEMLGRKLPAGDPVARELAGYISSEVDRTNDLVKRFLEFARPFRLQLEPAQLSEVVDRAIQQEQARASARQVTILRNDSPDLSAVLIDARWIEQLIANLLANAIDASASGSVVTVLTRPLDGGFEIGVFDRGTGIDAAVRANIFNPFFTTKADGTGLGLAIVSKIVDEHRGRIFVDSTPSEGTSIRVWLPDRASMSE
jgi:two-component system, NtrC family, sensor histidine kinase HydH